MKGVEKLLSLQWQGKTFGEDRVGAVPDEDDVALSHMLVGVCREEEVAIPGCLHHLVQPWLVDGQLLHSQKFDL